MLASREDFSCEKAQEARKHEAQTGVYIRPICLIQVERTGKDQRKVTVPAGVKKANREDGDQFVLDLFGFVAEDELNGLENKVATFLDKQERLFFWYRNRARHDYFVQGWRSATR